MKGIIWFCLLLVVISTSCCGDKEKAHGYEIPQNDGLHALPGLDHGLIQSPVNILTVEAAEHLDHDIMIIQDDTTMSHNLINTGHSVKLEFDAGTAIKFNGKTYEFLQAHFHTPSEHQIDGITYPMEIHFVCKENSEIPNYLVAGAFFKMGQENPFIKSFIERIPESSDQTTHLSDPAYIDDLLSPEEPFNDYYHYSGSLTTPPYTESVEWFLMKRILEASPEQIRYINKLEGNNARHVQALFERKIEQ
jgi:carbonic anhydrase